jgi:hypothetical protein
VLRASVCAAWVTPLPVWGPSTSMHRLSQKQHLHTALVPLTRCHTSVVRRGKGRPRHTAPHNPRKRQEHRDRTHCLQTAPYTRHANHTTAHPASRLSHSHSPGFKPHMHTVFKTSPADATCKACLWAALSLSRGSGQRDVRVVHSGVLHRQGRDAPVGRRLAWGGSLHTARRPRLENSSFLKSSKFF